MVKPCIAVTLTINGFITLLFLVGSLITSSQTGQTDVPFVFLTTWLVSSLDLGHLAEASEVWGIELISIAMGTFCSHQYEL